MTELEREIYILNGGGYQPIGRINEGDENDTPPTGGSIQQDD